MSVPLLRVHPSTSTGVDRLVEELEARCLLSIAAPAVGLADTIPVSPAPVTVQASGTDQTAGSVPTTSTDQTAGGSQTTGTSQTTSTGQTTTGTGQAPVTGPLPPVAAPLPVINPVILASLTSPPAAALTSSAVAPEVLGPTPTSAPDAVLAASVISAGAGSDLAAALGLQPASAALANSTTAGLNTGGVSTSVAALVGLQSGSTTSTLLTPATSGTGAGSDLAANNFFSVTPAVPGTASSTVLGFSSPGGATSADLFSNFGGQSPRSSDFLSVFSTGQLSGSGGGLVSVFAR